MEEKIKILDDNLCHIDFNLMDDNDYIDYYCNVGNNILLDCEINEHTIYQVKDRLIYDKDIISEVNDCSRHCMDELNNGHNHAKNIIRNTFELKNSELFEQLDDV